MGDLPRPRLRRAPTTGGDMSRDPTLYFYDGSVIVVTSIIIYLLVVLELVDRRLSAIGVGVFGFLNQLAFGVFYRLIAPTRWHMKHWTSYWTWTAVLFSLMQAAERLAANLGGSLAMVVFLNALSAVTFAVSTMFIPVWFVLKEKGLTSWWAITFRLPRTAWAIVGGICCLIAFWSRHLVTGQFLGVAILILFAFGVASFIITLASSIFAQERLKADGYTHSLANQEAKFHNCPDPTPENGTKPKSNQKSKLNSTNYDFGAPRFDKPASSEPIGERKEKDYLTGSPAQMSSVENSTNRNGSTGVKLHILRASSPATLSPQQVLSKGQGNRNEGKAFDPTANSNSTSNPTLTNPKWITWIDSVTLGTVLGASISLSFVILISRFFWVFKLTLDETNSYNAIYGFLFLIVLTGLGIMYVVFAIDLLAPWNRNDHLTQLALFPLQFFLEFELSILFVDATPLNEPEIFCPLLLLIFLDHVVVDSGYAHEVYCDVTTAISNWMTVPTDAESLSSDEDVILKAEFFGAKHQLIVQKIFSETVSTLCIFFMSIIEISAREQLGGGILSRSQSKSVGLIVGYALKFVVSMVSWVISKRLLTKRILRVKSKLHGIRDQTFQKSQPTPNSRPADAKVSSRSTLPTPGRRSSKNNRSIGPTNRGTGNIEMTKRNSQTVLSQGSVGEIKRVTSEGSAIMTVQLIAQKKDDESDRVRRRVHSVISRFPIFAGSVTVVEIPPIFAEERVSRLILVLGSIVGIRHAFFPLIVQYSDQQPEN
ncbi:hypothetical protein AAMO2058_000090600 [Amorphochlora amoebiformis]